MEEIKDIAEMLELMSDPCFCAKDFQIILVNQEASRLFIREQMDLKAMISDGLEAYSAFSGGCLYLSLDVCGKTVGASVVRLREYAIFVLDREGACHELQALALAALQLRKPLTGLMASHEQLRMLSGASAEMTDSLCRLSQGLAQLQRIVCNMSDAYSAPSRQEYQNIPALIQEIVEKAQTMTVSTGVSVTYEGTNEQILGLADAQELERAVLNLLSNALKHTPAGGSIAISLTRQSRMLYLRIQDSGSGIAEEIIGNVFRRFQRQPGIEEASAGLGLGMVLIRTAASHHGGTVLIDQPAGTGTRITMTIAIHQDGSSLRSPVLRVDYAGGRDHTLLELSDVLPPQLFAKE